MSEQYAKSVHYYGNRVRDYARDTVTGYSPNHVVELISERVISVRNEIAVIWFLYVAVTVGLVKLDVMMLDGEVRSLIMGGIVTASAYVGIVHVKPWLKCRLNWYKQWYEMNKDLRERSKQPYWWLNQ